jgi:hypothetical protein
MRGIFLYTVVLYLFCSSCGNSTDNISELNSSSADPTITAIPGELTNETVEEISKNISSPVEIANLLQVLSVPFSPEYLASHVDPGKQTTAFNKAITLGILGADLGYLNIYGKTSTAIDILSSIRILAEGNRVGQFFDFETIRRLSLDRASLDSLLYLSVDSYSRIDKYLRDNDRAHLSSLLVIGVWIEGQYLATQFIREYPDPALRDRIGEQKVILNDLISLANPYCSRDAEFQSLCNYLKEIKEKYRDVKITYTLGEPVSVERDGGLIVKQTETSKVEMTDEQLADIIKITKNIRDKLILND